MVHLLGFTCDMFVEMSSSVCVCTQTYMHIAYIQQTKVYPGTHACMYACARARTYTDTADLLLVHQQQHLPWMSYAVCMRMYTHAHLRTYVHTVATRPFG